MRWSVEVDRLVDAIDASATPSHRRKPLQLLAVAAASGDEWAIEALVVIVDRHDLAKAAIDRQLYSPTDREDVRQDVLLLVARSIGSFRGDAAFTTWLHRVATNAALGFVRARSREAEPTDQTVTSSARISSMIATRQDVAEVIRSLPDRYRDAVLLRDVEQLSYAEVAERLDLNLNTARARIARGRALASRRLSLDGERRSGD